MFPGRDVLTFLCPAVQRRMFCFALVCFVLNKILVSVLDVFTVELHPALQALPSSLKQTCLSPPGFGRTLPS